MGTHGSYPGEATPDPIQDMIAGKKDAKSAGKTSLALCCQLIALKNVNSVNFAIWPLENIKKNAKNGAKMALLVAITSASRDKKSV